ncbi:Uncharacterised protein at_DN1054, partial [Pycnogonum litorale]
MLTILGTPCLPGRYNHERFSTICDCISNTFLLQHNYLEDNFNHTDRWEHDNGTEEYRELINAACRQPEVLRLATWIDVTGDIVESLAKVTKYIPGTKTLDELRDEKGQVNSWQRKGCPLKVTWGFTTCIMEFQSSRWILPRPCIQQLHNKLCDTLSVLLYCTLATPTFPEPNVYPLTLDFIKSLHTTHLLNPDSFFAIAAALEGLATGLTLMKCEDWDNQELLETLVDNLIA